MNVDRRTLIKSVGGMAATTAVAGCVSLGGGSSGSAQMWFKREGKEVDAIQANIEAFNEESDHTIEGSNHSDLQKKTKTAIPAGNGPHFFGWAHDWVGDYYQRGFLSDQSEDLEVSLDEFTAPAQEAVQFDGATLGLPFSSETVGLIYNKELVDSPPETLADMQSIMEEHHDPDNGTYGLSYPLDAYFYSAWAHAFGGYYYDESKDELGLTKSSTLKGFRTVIEDLYPYSPEDPGYDPQAAVFQDGNAPFAINGPWFLGNVEFDAGVAPLPSVDGNEPTPYTGISMLYFAKKMGDDENGAAAARAFAEWYTTNESLLTKNSEDFGFIPVLESLQGSSDLPSSVQGFSQNVAMGTPMPTHPHMNQVWGPTEDGFTRALNGNMGLEKSMQQAEETIKSNW